MIKRAGLMRIEIILDQTNPVGSWIIDLKEGVHKFGIIQRSALIAHFHIASPVCGLKASNTQQAPFFLYS